MSKKNAIRKLKEFHRWQRIANSLDLTYNELYQFDIEYHSFRRKLLEISRECALEELDAIKHAINRLSKIAYRQILFECYLNSEKLSNQEIMTKLNRSESWYYETKKRALLEFAKYYRGGCLL
ncbi:TPA: ArpU family phage packaging/lysis transcriptional regulator [Streptococcus pyogenes]|uniref:ArpU family phage packaging/lysis transcriptional regulator n=1 Tax=Streptococcus pyogenes TaxID=1314 RepID=UPI000DA3880D|nr:ArpU family phage packaging/lysis transcriptional regulator [Streptococcus pyogenes]SQG41787.1 ArpU family phage encoded transcriptional regulator [Streptococcus pyogenes]VGQ23156.1 ArpU family phage encoded transcriptional regulator [Streptococcus pyogenes]VGQ30289.1 ArpU family phage encoded transcriptional regulator [Streptococcus pyogenes]VGQ72745.1 ArpU family phage encoded transcriptional regulator [Streptococcus pyogenes]VGR00880.1 ArpU family phage encoded transcriptional regulator 